MSLTMHDDVDRRPTSKRDVKAAVEYLATDEVAPDVYAVYNDEGGAYTVDARSGACTCRDFQFRSGLLGEDSCKHARRVRMERGERPLPPIPESEVDPLLWMRLEGQ